MTDPTAWRIDHVQIAMPHGQEDRARSFVTGVLGIPEIPKPAELSPNGVWFAAGAVELHYGVEFDFAPARKAHPAIVVDELDAVSHALDANGYEIHEAETLEGVRRLHTHDPFGNRIEFMGR